MNDPSDEQEALVNSIESAIEDINNAAVVAAELQYDEIASWLEWLGEELEDMLFNVLQTPPGPENTLVD
jgi:hypothetical protein